MRKAVYPPAVPPGYVPIEFGCIGVIGKRTVDHRLLTGNMGVRFPVPVMLYGTDFGELDSFTTNEVNLAADGVGFIHEVETVEIATDTPKTIIRAEGWVRESLVDMELWPAINTSTGLVDTIWEPGSDLYVRIIREWDLIGVTLHRDDPGCWPEVIPGVFR